MPGHVDDEDRRARAPAAGEVNRLPHALAPAFVREGPAHDAFHVPSIRAEPPRARARVDPSAPRSIAPPSRTGSRGPAARRLPSTCRRSATPVSMPAGLARKNVPCRPNAPAPSVSVRARMVVVEPRPPPGGAPDVLEVRHEGQRERAVGEEDRRRSEDRVADHLPRRGRQMGHPHLIGAGNGVAHDELEGVVAARRRRPDCVGELECAVGPARGGARASRDDLEHRAIRQREASVAPSPFVHAPKVTPTVMAHPSFGATLPAVLRTGLRPLFTLSTLFLLAACGGENASAPAATFAAGPGSPAPITAPAQPAAPYAARPDGKPDLAVVHRIKEEAYRRGQVMDHLFWLTDVNGPRLTASPGFRSAADWAVRTLATWGASERAPRAVGALRARVERAEVRALARRAGGYARLAGRARRPGRAARTARSPGAPRPRAALSRTRRTATTRSISPSSRARIQAYAQDVAGQAARALRPHRPAARPGRPRETEPLALRRQEARRARPRPGARAPRALDLAPPALPARREEAPRAHGEPPGRGVRRLLRPPAPGHGRALALLATEGVLGVLSTDDRGEGALVFAESTGEWEASQPLPPPAVVMPPEDYDRLARLAEKKRPGQGAPRRADRRARTRTRRPTTSSPSSRARASSDELVMLGAHLDSWHAGTGATDNGAGCAVMLEAIRILKRSTCRSSAPCASRCGAARSRASTARAPT